MKFAGALALLMFSGVLLAQALPPGMTMHRANAGKLDASGWVTAASTQGGFSVRLPCTFNDFTMEGKNPVEPVSRGFTVGCLKPDKTKFSATRIHYRQGDKDAREFFDKSARSLNLPGAKLTKSTFMKMPVLDVTTVGEGRCGYLRFVQAGADNILMAAEAGQDACAALALQSGVFFKSLALKK